MPSVLKRLAQCIYLMAVILCGALSVHGFTYCQSGVESNFLIDDDRVMFVQADGSLTVLDLESGAVLVRNRDGYFSGNLVKTDAGILVLNYGTLFLLEARNFSVIWQTKSHYDVNISGNRIVSYDGNGMVECRRLKDGVVLWTHNLPGALSLVEQDGKVLIHRAATYEEEIPTTVLVDLESGKEIFRKVPPAKTHWEDCYFDGTNIYIKAGVFEGNRSDFKVTQMLVWNTRGEEIERVPIDSTLAEEIRFGDSPFEANGKTFWKGNVYPSRDSIRSERMGKMLPTAEGNEDSDSWNEAYQLDEVTTIRTQTRRDFRNKKENSSTSACEIEVQTEKGSWSGTLTYMPPSGRVTAATRVGDKLLIGSNFGHVECIEAGTGKSLWLYVFPTHRQTMSYSSHGMPPMMADAAKTFRRENAHPPTMGIELSEGKSSVPKIILDPLPMDPFYRLPFYLAVAWVGAGVPLLGILFLARKRKREKASHLSATSLLLCLLSLGVFMMFGRVSMESSVALRIASASAIVFGGIFAMKSVRSARTVGVVLIGCFIGLALFSFPFMLRL